MKKIKFPLASTTWDESEYSAIQEVIESGHFSMGKKVQDFETAFAKYIGSKHAVMVNSGSSANLIMTAAMFYTKTNALKAGDEVIVPAVSWSTTYFPLHQYGLKLKFVDIDLDTLNYDLEALAEAISDKTRLIMVVNLLGNPNDFDCINSLIKGRNIRFIEDNCESLGASFGGKMAGTHGLMGSFSSFFSHHISTMEGGVVVTDDEELFHILLSLRAHGWTRNLPTENHIIGRKSDNAFDESFRFVLPGYNLRPLEMSGAIGLEQIKKLPQLIANRRHNGAAFSAIMTDHSEFIIQSEIGKSSWFGFSLIIRPSSQISREMLINKLNTNGFETRPIVSGNFVKNEVLKYLDYSVHGALANADHLDLNGLFIGNHHYTMSDALDILSSMRF